MSVSLHTNRSMLVPLPDTFTCAELGMDSVPTNTVKVTVKFVASPASGSSTRSALPFSPNRTIDCEEGDLSRWQQVTGGSLKKSDRPFRCCDMNCIAQRRAVTSLTQFNTRRRIDDVGASSINQQLVTRIKLERRVGHQRHVPQPVWWRCQMEQAISSPPFRLAVALVKIHNSFKVLPERS